MDTKPPRANLLQTAGQRTAAGARSGGRGGKGLWLLLIFSPCVGFTFTHLLHLISPPLRARLHCRCHQHPAHKKPMPTLPSLAAPHTPPALRGCSTSGLKRHSDRQQSPPRSGQSSFTSPPPLNHTPNSTLWRLLENLTPTFVSLFRSCLRLFCGTGFIPSKPKHFLVTSILN